MQRADRLAFGPARVQRPGLGQRVFRVEAGPGQNLAVPHRDAFEAVGDGLDGPQPAIANGAGQFGQRQRMGWRQDVSCFNAAHTGNWAATK